jgi:hypothetical protein
MNNNNPLWFNIIMQINLLEERKWRLIEERSNINAQIADTDHSIALLQVSGAQYNHQQIFLLVLRRNYTYQLASS